MSTDTPSPADLQDRRDELDVTLTEVASHLTDHPEFDLAESTLSSRVGEWERGDREASEGDLAALDEVLDEIEAEQNFSYPECTGCPYTPQLDIDYVDGDPYCIICTYEDPDQGADA